MILLRPSLARLVGAIAFAAAAASVQATTFTQTVVGTLATDSDIRTIDFTLGDASDVRAWTRDSSFDTLLSMFSLDSGALLAFSDDIGNPYPQIDAGQALSDAGLMLADLAPGNYRLVLSVSPNLPVGELLSDGFTAAPPGSALPAGGWTVELAVSDAQPVPGPAAWSVLAAGLAIVGAARRRREREAA